MTDTVYAISAQQPLRYIIKKKKKWGELFCKVYLELYGTMWYRIMFNPFTLQS